MKVTFQQAEKLLKGDQEFQQFAFAMLLTSLRERYAHDSSQATIQNCMDEINAFLTKYQAVMAEDFAVIKSM